MQVWLSKVFLEEGIFIIKLNAYDLLFLQNIQFLHVSRYHLRWIRSVTLWNIDRIISCVSVVFGI